MHFYLVSEESCLTNEFDKSLESLRETRELNTFSFTQQIQATLNNDMYLFINCIKIKDIVTMNESNSFEFKKCCHAAFQ